MGRVLLAIFVSFIATTLYANKYPSRVINKNEKRIPDVQIVMTSANNDTISVVRTNKKGEFSYNDSVAFLYFSHPEYQDLKMNVTYDKDHVFTLLRAYQLGELVVTADAVKEFATHDSYIISRGTMKRYVNSLHILNEIPFIHASIDGQLSYKGQGGVALMINGIPASSKEVAALSKDEIKHVDLYTTPPPEYVGQNVQAVVDYILKDKLTGGNGAINTRNSVTEVYGSNNAYLYYNYKSSKFSVSVDNAYSRGWGATTDETLSYNFEGIDYVKMKTGDNIKSRSNENTATIAYQNAVKQNYSLNVSVKGNIDRVNKQENQNVMMTNGNRFSALNATSTPFQNITAAARFKKYLGDNAKYGSATAHFSYSTGTGKNYSSYQEFALTENAEPFFAETSIHQRTNTLHGQLEYNTDYKPWGLLSFSISDYFTDYKQLDEPIDNYSNSNTLSAYGYYYVKYKKFRYWAAIGFLNNISSSTYANVKENTTKPMMQGQIVYNPNKRIQLNLNYTYIQNNPSVSQRTSTPQWQDTYWVFEGNPYLNNYVSHDINVSGAYENNYVQVSGMLSWRHAPNTIGTMFEQGDKYILETLVNQQKYDRYITHFWLRIFPLGKKFWDITGNADIGWVIGKNHLYSYHGKPTNYSVSSSINLTKWNFGGHVQFQSEKFNGSTTRTRPFLWKLYAYYRPIENLTVGVDWNSPFMKRCHEREWSVKESLVQINRNYYGPAFANQIAINLNYYFSFGKHRNNYENIYTGTQTETGVLRRDK